MVSACQRRFLTVVSYFWMLKYMYRIILVVGCRLQCHKCKRRDCQHADVIKYAVDNKDTQDIPNAVLQIVEDLIDF